MVNQMMTRMRALVRDDEGQDLIEYALLAGLISLVAVAAITTAGGHVNGIFGKIGEKLGTANK
jgi:pilus assembly protein Flp/PilA